MVIIPTHTTLVSVAHEFGGFFALEGLPALIFPLSVLGGSDKPVHPACSWELEAGRTPCSPIRRSPLFFFER